MKQRNYTSRGTDSNPTGRFEDIQRNPSHPDPLFIEESGEEFRSSSPATEILIDHAKEILTSNNSPDVGFSKSVNPYRGCEHGCIYCYARPTHEYLGLSAGIDFETKIFAKRDAPELLRKALLKKSYKPEVIALSGVTDPYQPVEKELRLTRQCISVLRDFKNPCAIITKSNLVTRDIDLLSEMAQQNLISVRITITTLDEDIRRRLEKNFPNKKNKVLERIRSLRDGSLNDSSFKTRGRGAGVYSDEIASLFRAGLKKSGIQNIETELRTDLFSRKEAAAQPELF